MKIGMLKEGGGIPPGATEPAPAVVALNGLVASLAVIEALQLLLGVFESPISRIVYRADHRMVRTVAVEFFGRRLLCLWS